MKKILSLAILALLCNVAFSQIDTLAVLNQANMLNQTGALLYSNGKTEEALKVYNQAANMTKDIDAGVQQYLTAIYTMGLIYYEIGDFQNSLEYLIPSSEIIGKYIPASTDYLEVINDIATIYINIGDAQNAIIYYVKAFTTMAQITGLESPECATYMTVIGILYSSLHEYANAEQCLLSAINVFEKTNNKDNPNYGNSIYHYGSIKNMENEYQTALAYLEKALKIKENTTGKETDTYAENLNEIGYSYYGMGDYQNALKYYMQAMEIRKKVLGEEHPDYAASLNNIGVAYSDMGEYQNALKYYLQALGIRKKVFGEEHPDYAASLNNIGSLYHHLGDYKNALKYHLQAIEIQKKVIGTEHPDYALSLGNISAIYEDMGDYKNALKYGILAMEIRKKVLGEEHPDYAASLNNIGLVYNDMDDFQNALKYHTKALEIRGKILGEEHTDYAASLNNLALTYDKMGDYQNALKYYLASLKISKKNLGEEHPQYATYLSNISIPYTKMGDYQNALKYQQQALDIRKKIFGENNPDYAQSLSNIGAIYNEMGDYKNALKYNIQASEIQKKSLGENHKDYIASLGNIGLAYQNLGDYQNALKYMKQTLEGWGKIYGREHSNYAVALLNIGSLYKCMEDYNNALKYYAQALEIQGKVHGEENPEYAKSLNNIGIVYTVAGDNQNALKYYTQAMKIWESSYGKNHHTYAISLKNIGVVYSTDKNFAEAIKKNKEATDICKNNLIKNFSFMTAHEREAYWNANKEYFSQNINYTYHTPDNTLATKASYDSELITKGLLLASEVSMTNIIMESGNKALISEYETLRTAHLQLNKELEKPIAERLYNCDSLENEIQKMERHIMENCKEFGDVTHFIKIDWKEVQNSLKPNDVAIEFSNFTEDDTTRYVAFVLTKDTEAPVCVPLFEQSEMQKLQRGSALTKTQEQEPTDEENRGAFMVSAKKQGIYESTGLYNMLWKPLEKYFPANPRIYFAPSGMLHQIAIEYAPVGEGKLVSDKYEMYRISSTRYLAMDYMPKPLKTSVLYGGILYDSDTTTMKRESNRYSTRSAEMNSFAALNKDEARSALQYLQGTKTEVEDIADKMKKKKISTTLYEGSQANEESFKALSGNDIAILHIATHGFFLPTDKKLSGDQSLIQSGLLLSGANYAWQNQPLPEGIEDGILTAKEISFMDLRKTDLVVLSACQTALGEITGEGVFGLQRGFKKAGARTIIMSLWPVDDNATLLMMSEFYTNLTNGMSKREAFLAAQNKVKTTAGFENPRFWAAFIMLDGNEK